MKRATVVVIALAGVLLAGGAGLVAKRMRAPAAEPASAPRMRARPKLAVVEAQAAPAEAARPRATRRRAA